MWSTSISPSSSSFLMISIQHLYMWSCNYRKYHKEQKRISIQHLYMWSANVKLLFYIVHAISIQHLYMWSLIKKSMIRVPEWFQYNICTCGANDSWTWSSGNLNFNTTFVHVEQNHQRNHLVNNHDFNTTFVHVELAIVLAILLTAVVFQYNICTCGAYEQIIRSTHSPGFQYNICTCGAYS